MMMEYATIAAADKVGSHNTSAKMVCGDGGAEPDEAYDADGPGESDGDEEAEHADGEDDAGDGAAAEGYARGKPACCGNTTGRLFRGVRRYIILAVIPNTIP
jgi:hypothetical protein